MVEKRNLVFILIVVAVVLGIMFLLSSSNEFRQIVQGLAPSDPADVCSEYCSGEIAPGGCVLESPPVGCPYSDAEGTCGILTEICGTCGCVVGECQPDGTCSSNSANTDGGDDDDSNSLCSSHWDCGNYNLCVNSNGELLTSEEELPSCDVYGEDCGKCQYNEAGDGFCASEGLPGYGGIPYETCVYDFGDCEGERAECDAGDICEEHPLFPGTGQCALAEIPNCDDGTPLGQCSNSTYGAICQLDNDLPVLIQSCQACQFPPYENCPTGYDCQVDGSCLLIIQESPEGEDGVQGESSFTPYCEQYGGICSDSCSGDYYKLDQTDEDFAILHDSCSGEDSGSICCYPYANDDINDCEYYGGSCLSSCEGDFYSPDVPYLDDECNSYSGEDTVCCLEYTQPEESEIKQEGGFLGTLFGSEKYESDESINLTENISLNRDYLILGFGFLIIAVFLVILVYPKYAKKGKRKK